MARQLTSFVQAKSLNITNLTADAASTRSVAINGAKRASFLIDMGISAPDTDVTASDATIAVTIQYSTTDVASDYAATGVATDISAAYPPTTGTLAVTSDAPGLYWIDMDLGGLGITTGYLRAYADISAASDFGVTTFPVGVIALLYGRDGGTPSNSDVKSIVQSYST